MAKASKKDRIIAWFFAGIFIISTCALTLAIVIDAIQRNKQADNGATSQQASTSNNANQENKTMLQGTQLENFTPVSDVAALQKTDVTPGEGQEVKAGDTVTVDYTGAVAATGVIFQSSKDSGQTVSFGLNQVIKGWTDGVPGMKVGGTRRLLIPAEQAYGANPPANSGIPANAPLVFDITLHAIGQ